MNDETASEGTEAKSASRPEWMEEGEAALERIGDALRAAWDTTRDARLSALESAKLAARQLGEAIDRGIETGRERWQAETARDEEE